MKLALSVSLGAAVFLRDVEEPAPGVEVLALYSSPNHLAAEFNGPAAGGHANVDLALTRPLTFDFVECIGGSGPEDCGVAWIGNSP